MKYFSFTLAAIALILTGAGCAPTTRPPENAMMQKTDTTMMDDGSMDAMKSDDAMMMDDGDMMKDDEENMMDDGSMMKDDDAMMMDDETMDAMMLKGSYETYSPEKLKLAEMQDVVLFFRASWCPSCKAVDADIRANLSSIPNDLVILDVNYDDADELKRLYGVTYQHTFVQVNPNGTMLKKWSGSSTLEEITRMRLQ